MKSIHAVLLTIISAVSFMLTWPATAVANDRSETSHPTPTFNRDIAPIIHDKCMVCHRDGEVAPFPLTNYSQVKRRARQIALVTRRRYMPPWKPTAPHDAFADDRSLTDTQIALLQSWVDAGRPEGDPDDRQPPPTFPAGWRYGDPDIILELPYEFEIPAEGPDIYVHFVFPTELKTKKYIRAVQVRPSNLSAAHHGVVLLDGSGKARKQAIKQREPSGGKKTRHYYNFGDPGFLPRGFLPGFAPGLYPPPRDLSDPDGVGITLKPNLDIVLQMHYHPTGRIEKDRPRIGLYFTDVPPRRGPMAVMMANNQIDIPPGESRFQRTDSFKLPVDFEVRDIWGHMHIIGQRLEAWAILPDDSRRELIRIDDWDFNWQDTYRYKQPFDLPAGTTIHARWTWDNSDTNPRNPFSPPQRIRFGPNSHDEMTGLIIGGIPKRRGWAEAKLFTAVLMHYLKIKREEAAAK